jgi:hypothetical protein
LVFLGLRPKTDDKDRFRRSCAQKIARSYIERSLVIPEPFFQIGNDTIDTDAFLSAGIAITHGDGLIFGRFTVDRETEWAACFVHSRVTLADRLLDVVLY